MIELQIWGDFECPFSYLQTIVLLKLKEKYKDKLMVCWKSYELNVRENFSSPSPDYLESLRLAAKEHIAVDQQLRFLEPKTLPNIRIAQESVYFADTQNLSLEMAHAIFESFFDKNLDISDQTEILHIGATVGLDIKNLNDALDDAIFTKRVAADEKEFATLGFQAIPAMLIGEKDFSPRSFQPITGYKTLEELETIISQILKK